LFLRVLLREGDEALCAKITHMLDDCRKFVLLAGCSSVGELREKPLVITGFVRQWLDARGFYPARPGRI
jgi:isopentenyl diphosphate isomerase/L-lactate dehydrogenase-like FMN-dependent dehydrogenase